MAQKQAHLDRPAFSPTGTCGRTWGEPWPNEHRCDREPHGMKQHECACGVQMKDG